MRALACEHLALEAPGKLKHHAVGRLERPVHRHLDLPLRQGPPLLRLFPISSVARGRHPSRKRSVRDFRNLTKGKKKISPKADTLKSHQTQTHEVVLQDGPGFLSSNGGVGVRCDASVIQSTNSPNEMQAGVSQRAGPLALSRSQARPITSPSCQKGVRSIGLNRAREVVRSHKVLL